MALAGVLHDEMNHYIKERRLAGPQMPPPSGADLRRLLKLDCALSREAAPGFLATLLKSSGQQINADKLITTPTNGNSGWRELPWKP